MKFAVDSIVDEIAVLENIETKEKKEVNLSILPEDIQEGNILIFNNNNYIIDKQYESKRRESLREKLERLKALRKEDQEED